MILNFVCCYLLFVLVYINIDIGKSRPGDHLYGKLLFTWLSLVMSLMVSFCAFFFPRDVLDEIWD